MVRETSGGSDAGESSNEGGAYDIRIDDAAAVDEEPAVAGDAIAEGWCNQEFGAPQEIAELAGHQSRALAANSARVVSLVANVGGGVTYIDSLDGGRTFRPRRILGDLGIDNLQVVLSSYNVYLASGALDPPAYVTLGAAAIGSAAGTPAFATSILGPPNSYAATPVPSLDGKLAVLIQNDTLGGADSVGLYAATSEMPLDGSFTEPRRLSPWPVCSGAVWHSSGDLYVVYPVDRTPAELHVRRSQDRGTTFSAPIIRTNPDGSISCPKVFERPNGDLAIVTRESNDRSGLHETVTTFFSPSRQGLLPDRQIVFGASRSLCFDVAQTSTGQLYATQTLGTVGETVGQTVIARSDDAGLTWTSSLELPYGEQVVCPNLAASDELYMAWDDGPKAFFARITSRATCTAKR